MYRESYISALGSDGKQAVLSSLEVGKVLQSVSGFTEIIFHGPRAFQRSDLFIHVLKQTQGFPILPLVSPVRNRVGNSCQLLCHTKVCVLRGGVV